MSRLNFDIDDFYSGITTSERLNDFQQQTQQREAQKRNEELWRIICKTFTINHQIIDGNKSVLDLLASVEQSPSRSVSRKSLDGGTLFLIVIPFGVVALLLIWRMLKKFEESSIRNANMATTRTAINIDRLMTNSRINPARVSNSNEMQPDRQRSFPTAPNREFVYVHSPTNTSIPNGSNTARLISEAHDLPPSYEECVRKSS